MHFLLVLLHVLERSMPLSSGISISMLRNVIKLVDLIRKRRHICIYARLLNICVSFFLVMVVMLGLAAV